MFKLILTVLVLLSCGTFLMAQDAALFYNGELQDDCYLWVWGFTTPDETAHQTQNAGYSPGTKALNWAPYDNGGYQGLLIGKNQNFDLSSIWQTDSVYFKLKAPDGLDTADPNLNVIIYDSRDSDWEYCIWYELTDFQNLNDGEWHQFSIAIQDFERSTNPIDSTDIGAVSFEYFDTGMSSALLIDEVWIGQADVPAHMTMFDGQKLPPGMGFEAWGFENNDFVLAEGEGYMEGTPAILWETANWDWQGKGFIFPTHDFTYSMTMDSISLKIKAPAGIDTLALELYDENYSATSAVARRVLDDVVWDGGWKKLNIKLSEFSVYEGFDPSLVYEFAIVAAGTTIPERILIDDIWIGEPQVVIDLLPPDPPAALNVTDDINTPHINYISWADVEGESGETYTVYYSEQEITDLNDPKVFILEDGINEGTQLVVHRLYSPLEPRDVTYHYAITCTDAAANISETFTKSAPFTNTGTARSIIHFGAPNGFVADGYFDEWEGIMPFNIHPDRNPVVSGSISDSLDLSANIYLAMDETHLYLGFDVLDDVFSWKSDNTVDWWNDESIEFFIGFYEIFGDVSHHTYWGRGAEPDYRMVIRPNVITIDAWPGEDSILVAGNEDVYFESGGVSDYYVEAKIPLTAFSQVAGDSLFTPVKGMKVPIEIQINDADVVNSGEVARIQFGDNSYDDAWWNNPDIWTFTWIGNPISSIENERVEYASKYFLRDNYPNPFNPSTKIEYGLAKTANVTLTVYNVLGQEIKTLINQQQAAGIHVVEFDASSLSTGVYFYKLSTENYTQVKKMLLVK